MKIFRYYLLVLLLFITVFNSCNSDQSNDTSKQYFTISISEPANGYITLAPDKTLYEAGETITATATGNSDYSFSAWNGDINAITNPVSFQINSDMAFTASFVDSDYTFNPSVIFTGKYISSSEFIITCTCKNDGGSAIAISEAILELYNDNYCASSTAALTINYSLEENKIINISNSYTFTVSGTTSEAAKGYSLRIVVKDANSHSETFYQCNSFN